MPQPAPLTPTEQELIGQFVGFAERRAENGVYINAWHSESLSAPVVCIIAIGDQALALQQLVMANAQPEHSLIEVEYEPGDSNGQF